MAETSAAGALYGVVRSTLVATFMSWNLATDIDQGSSTPNRSMETRRSSLSTMRELKARRSAPYEWTYRTAVLVGDLA